MSTQITTLGNMIRRARWAKGWSIRKLAVEAELSTAAIHRIESGGTVSPQGTTLYRIAQALELDLDDLLVLLDGESA